MPGYLLRANRDVVLGDQRGSWKPVDRLTVHVVVDNTTDMLSSRPKHVASELRVLMAAGMTGVAGEVLCSAHHGLCLAVTRIGTAKPAPCSWMRARTLMPSTKWPALRLDFGRIEALVLSHGHFDHSEGLVKALELIRGANGGHGAAARASRGLCQTGPAAAQWRTPSVPGCAAAAHARRAWARVAASAEAEEIVDGCFISVVRSPAGASSAAARPISSARRMGNWEADPWIMDERFWPPTCREKGSRSLRAVPRRGGQHLSPCPRSLSRRPAIVLVGGLHLVAPNEDIIPETIAASHLRPASDHPGTLHGMRAVHALISALARGSWIRWPWAAGKPCSAHPAAQHSLQPTGAADGPVQERFHAYSSHSRALVCYLDVLGGHACINSRAPQGSLRSRSEPAIPGPESRCSKVCSAVRDGFAGNLRPAAGNRPSG